MRTDVKACGCTWGCTDTMRKSALKVDSGTRIPCHTRKLKLHQWRAGQALYPLSYKSSQKFFFLNVPVGLTFTWWGCCGLCRRHNQPSLPTPFYSVLLSVSVFMALSTVFYSINSPLNSLLSHSVLLVLSLPY